MAELDSVPSSDPAAVPADTTPDQSLAEHEAQFGDPVPSPRDASDDDAEPPKAAAGRGPDGKFTKGARQRARSQQASPADAPRIAELTKRLRETEAERDRLKASGTPAPAPAPVAAAAPAPPAPVGSKTAAPAQTPWEAWTTKPEPILKDYTDYGEWIKDWNRWDRAQEQKATTARTEKAAEEKRITENWSAQVTEARKKYDDYDQVALLAPTRIPPGSLIDAWILEDESGADVLYHLQQHPDELDGILALPVLKQAKALSLLGQRLTDSTPVATAAPATPPERLPRPPSAVRTGPTRPVESPPDDETGSLADHERFYMKSRRR